MPEEIESTQVTTPEAEDASGATAAESRGGRKPESAYRQLQSERDQARAAAQQAQFAQSQTEARLAQLERSARDAQVAARLSQLPDDQRDAELARYQWGTVQQELADAKAAASQAQQAYQRLEGVQGAQLAAMDLAHEFNLPKDIGGVPIVAHLFQFGGKSLEDMRRYAESLAAIAGSAGRAPAKAKEATRPHSKFAADGGTSAPQIPLTQRPKAERDAVWERLKSGDITHADIAAGRV